MTFWFCGALGSRGRSMLPWSSGPLLPEARARLSVPCYLLGGEVTSFPVFFFAFFAGYMAMDQYLLIPFLGGWTSIYQLFWCSPGVQGFDTLPYHVKSRMASQISWFSKLSDFCSHRHPGSIKGVPPGISETPPAIAWKLSVRWSSMTCMIWGYRHDLGNLQILKQIETVFVISHFLKWVYNHDCFRYVLIWVERAQLRHGELSRGVAWRRSQEEAHQRPGCFFSGDWGNMCCLVAWNQRECWPPTGLG